MSYYRLQLTQDEYNAVLAAVRYAASEGEASRIKIGAGEDFTEILTDSGTREDTALTFDQMHEMADRWQRGEFA
jgi:hypothetical protein